MRKVPPKVTFGRMVQQKSASTNAPSTKTVPPASRTQPIQPQCSSAPPVYRPQTRIAGHRPLAGSSVTMKAGLAAPPVYKPQGLVSQRKPSSSRPGMQAPPVYKPAVSTVTPRSAVVPGAQKSGPLPVCPLPFGQLKAHQNSPVAAETKTGVPPAAYRPNSQPSTILSKPGVVV